nr:RDD family protein [uncultured Friedmanniella sp.]
MATQTPAKPDRFTGLPPGVKVGPLRRRLAAHLIDTVVPAALLGVVWGTSGEDGAQAVGVVAMVLLAIWSLVVWWMFATRAAGPGMRLMRLQLVGFSDGRPIGWLRFLVRALVLGLVGITGVGLVLLLLFLLRHPRYQGWHDRAADSVVIVERMLAPKSPRSTAGDTGAPVRSDPVAPPPPPTSPASEPVSTPVATPMAKPAVEPVVAGRVAAPAGAVTSSEASVPTAEEAPAPAPAARTWVVVLDDGREVPVRGLVVLGRNPHARPGEDSTQLVKLADDTRTVSKSHLALNLDSEGRLLAADRSSTNGSTVTTADGVTTACVPEQAIRVPEGSVISMGDHWLTVRRD